MIHFLLASIKISMLRKSHFCICNQTQSSGLKITLFHPLLALNIYCSFFFVFTTSHSHKEPLLPIFSIFIKTNPFINKKRI
jgi:hypothetical protein